MSKTNAPDQRRRAFAEFVAQGKSGTEAARLAGYSGTDASLRNQASRLMTNDGVKTWIAAAAEKASNLRVFDAAARREILRQIAEGEIDQVIETTGSGSNGPIAQTQTRKPTSAERVAAIKHLDELDGLMVQKIEHTGKDGQPMAAVLAAIPTEVIRERLAELAKRKTK